MGFLLDKCTFRTYDKSILDNCEVFDCGNADLNEFFSKDSLNYTSQLLGKSYCFTLDEDERKVVASFTISNDSIKTFELPNSRKKKLISRIPRAKHMKNYPAVLIGRLGVSKDFPFKNLSGEEKSIGDQVMDFIKAWFISPENKTGCRFIVVDAYNNEGTLKYYRRNGFQEIFSTEEQEKEFYEIPIGRDLVTRVLYFDLILLAR